MVVAGAVMGTDGKWEKTHVEVDRFELAGETWIPWCPTVLAGSDRSLHVFFIGNRRSEYVFIKKLHTTVRA